MQIVCYPDHNKDDKNGPVGRFLKDLEKSRPDLWTLVDATLKKVGKSSNLSDLEDMEWVGRLGHTTESIYEFRIPPTKSGGVVRLYFGYKKGDNTTIVILTAELKKTKKADKDKIKETEKRFRERCK